MSFHPFHHDLLAPADWPTMADALLEAGWRRDGVEDGGVERFVAVAEGVALELHLSPGGQMDFSADGGATWQELNGLEGDTEELSPAEALRQWGE